MKHRMIQSANGTLVLSGICIFILVTSARTHIVPLPTNPGFLDSGTVLSVLWEWTRTSCERWIQDINLSV